MSTYQNFGIISTQKLIQQFTWKEKEFFSYLISFNEFDGFFRVIREVRHEQALIGAQVLFNIKEDTDQISGYKIIGYEEKKESNLPKVQRKKFSNNTK